MKDKGFFDLTNAKRAPDIAMLVCIAVFAFYINRDIEIKGLYMDDLYMWSFYGEQNFFEFVFPIGGSVSFRPIYWMLAYIEMAIVGPHVSWYAGFNVVSNILVAYSLFYICYKVAHCRLLAFLFPNLRFFLFAVFPHPVDARLYLALGRFFHFPQVIFQQQYRGDGGAAVLVQ